MLNSLSTASYNTLKKLDLSPSLVKSNEKTTNKATSQAISDVNLPSGVTAFAYSMQVTELNFTDSETKMVVRDDNSLAISAKSSLNVNLKIEQYRFDITLTAESLGLGKDSFADPTKPMNISLKYSQSQLEINQKISIKEVKTLRPAQEILRDLVKGLTAALRDPGNKSIMYTLDEEAVSSLVQSDPKLGKLFGELVMIMAAINLMKKQGEPSNDYVIHLSGKGKPYYDLQEEIDAKGFQKDYEFNITILPPQEVVEESAAIEAETQILVDSDSAKLV